MARRSQARPPMPHRGRIQAQGNGVEKSELWGQAEPPTKTVMIRLLDNLYYEQLTKREQEERERCYDCARRYILRAPAEGYPRNSPTNRPANCVDRRSRRGDVRIDIEITDGHACVDDPQPE